MSHTSTVFEKISLSPLSLLHRKSSFLWSLYSAGLREERRKCQTDRRRGGGRRGEKIGEMTEVGEKVGERQSDALFTALQCQSNFSLLG